MVYRAWDRTLKREVAIKRILAGDDAEQREEATRQLEKETGALAAIQQHPNIVTIYDVGSDEDGPFVVMELISGETLDEIVTRAPLTWTDFRELVVQIQEALIAAQDLGLLHRDLKPSNIMLNWLPSGRFQAKIVDFGLAKFSAGPSMQTIDQHDSIFGSIHYMAPEQFERAALDSRADMYAIGCVYYFALAGRPPFEGDTAPQVMAAHLEHRVIPLSKLRPDVPSWAADWVMWHMNRYPAERPENARESLKSFIQLDVPSTQTVVASERPAPKVPRRPNVAVPGVRHAGAAASVAVQGPVVQPITAPQPLMPPAGAPPSVHTATHGPAEVVEPAPAAPAPAPVAAKPTIAPKLVAPGGGTKTASAGPVPSPPRTATMVKPTMMGSPVTRTPSPAEVMARKQAKKAMSQREKSALALVLGILVLILGFAFAKHLGNRKQEEAYNEVLRRAADTTTTSIPVSGSELKMLLEAAVRPGSNPQRETIYRGLRYAEATDGTNVDEELVHAVTKSGMEPSIRQELLTQVIGPRKQEEVAGTLVKFAQETTEASGARDALTAVSQIGGTGHFPEILGILRITKDREVREAAEKAGAAVLQSEGTRASRHAEALLEAYRAAPLPEVKSALLRLMGRTGDDLVAVMLKDLLTRGSETERLNAALAMQFWPNHKMYPTMIEVLSQTTDANLRQATFEGAVRFLVARRGGEEAWKLLAAHAHTAEERLLIIHSLAQRETEDWAIALVEGMAKDPDAGAEVIDHAEKAIRQMREGKKPPGAEK